MAKAPHIIRYTKEKLKWYHFLYHQKRNQGVFAFHLNANIGFFAQLSMCLRILSVCEKFDRRPSILLSSPFYTRSPGDNWLDYFFKNQALTELDLNKLAAKDIKHRKINNVKQLGIRSLGIPRLTLPQANQLFHKYLTILPDIQEYLDAFCRKHFHEKTVLGVHFRGTDKAAEATPVAWPHIADNVNLYLKNNPQTNLVFVSSDDQLFVEWFCNEINQVEVVLHEDKGRSCDGKPPHQSVERGDNYLKGKEALINCLLLSKCDALIRTASFLSGWASVFNPNIPVIMLNKPHREALWFPDNVILKNCEQIFMPSQ